MKPPASFCALGSEFDAFLFAAIGEDRDGTPLCVVSVLGRLDLDPWHEAASLAAMSVEAATAKLTSLLSTLPAASLTRLDPLTMASRLIAFLPRRTDSGARSSATGVETTVATRRPVPVNVVLLAIYIILILGDQFIDTHRPPARADSAHVSAPPAPSGSGHLH